ncbi:ABC transporter ATP-binding protein [Methylocella sp. CPCC 101449]|jgi:NitT/TauT family transport system ATP-binding protein|uniref:ABC transporter ATP-binding protein n=1 Tax=Methylocella sp. CPCC 101449 TaxID=2987531 RepID=UPI0028904C67|nr:ABC transporter ATP-binding protein [Methylocella sp. CPCC 101449]MDT2023529.1 ABC transporter ATP-binding protein [Methylocella sp. CPCC 101449]HEV2573934.1 ABC transporter ATP-binding protein [Beijerinckiaceae bacterium]
MQNNQDKIAISIRNVTQRFGDASQPDSVLALDNVSLDIKKGEFVCLLGPSGCGKSTLLNVVGGLFKPTSGTATVEGRLVDGKPHPDKIAFVFQESTLFPWYTVIENFHIALKFQGIPKAEWDDRAMAALRAVGMASFARHYPDQLSVGMRQRVNMARGICVKTDILLMDEPFAALDEQTRMVLGEDLSQLLAETGKTIVFVTHSLAEAVFLSDRIAVFTARPGKIKTIIDVDTPHPRSPDFMLEPKFSELRNECYALLRDEIRATMALQRDPQAV